MRVWKYTSDPHFTKLSRQNTLKATNGIRVVWMGIQTHCKSLMKKSIIDSITNQALILSSTTEIAYVTLTHLIGVEYVTNHYCNTIENGENKPT